MPAPDRLELAPSVTEPKTLTDRIRTTNPQAVASRAAFAGFYGKPRRVSAFSFAPRPCNPAPTAALSMFHFSAGREGQ
jgi:hypothetical protein